MSTDDQRGGDTQWRTGYGGSLERLEERDGRFDLDWDEATLEVRDAAHVYDEIIGSRRKREQRKIAEQSRYLQ